MNKQLVLHMIGIICLIFILALLVYFIYKPVKDTFINTNIVCDKRGCPSDKTNNTFYKIHTEYKKIRDTNKLLAHKTEPHHFIFKQKGPSNIFIIRHAEKFKSKFALDCNGILRSTYISNVIEDLNKLGFGIHSIITPYDYSDMHKVQTISIASWLMNINIFMYGEKDDVDKTINHIYKNSYYDGKTILICWEHDCIQKLLKSILSIGSKAKNLTNYVFKNIEGTDKLPYWNVNNYSSIYHLDNSLNLNILEENIQTCNEKDNDIITYGKKQKCKK
jgi:hypothetical protein